MFWAIFEQLSIFRSKMEGGAFFAVGSTGGLRPRFLLLNISQLLCFITSEEAACGLDLVNCSLLLHFTCEIEVKA